MNPLIIFFLTLFVGPLMFYIISKIEKYDKKIKRFPSGLAASVGDTIFLPLFNGLATNYGIFDLFLDNFFILNLLILLTFIIWILYVIYKKDLSTYNHWIRPKKGKLSYGGWYHSAYVAVQFFFIIFSLFYFYDKIFLWLSLLGYLITLIQSKFQYGF